MRIARATCIILAWTAMPMLKPHSLTKVIGPKLLSAVDLAGTFLFAVEGATAAIAGHLDLLGIMVLSFATALAGGVIRDLLIGAVPPEAFRDWRYSVVAFIAAGFVFVLHQSVQQVPSTLLMVLDAAGLGLLPSPGLKRRSRMAFIPSLPS
jgi:uncharacterized membrane protein YeiH